MLYALSVPPRISLRHLCFVILSCFVIPTFVILLLPLRDRNQLVGRYVFLDIPSTAQPPDFDPFGAIVLPQPEMERRAKMALVTAPTVDLCQLRQAAGCDANLRTHRITIRRDTAQSNPEPVVSGLRDVADHR